MSTPEQHGVLCLSTGTRSFTFPRLPCRDAFFTSTPEQNAALVRTQYRGCWKRMLLERPHIRFDGEWLCFFWLLWNELE